jgi:hypothetical protein
MTDEPFHNPPGMRLLLLFALSNPPHGRRLFSTTTTLRMSKSLVVDPFCFRQFAGDESSKSYGGCVFDLTIEAFEEVVNKRYDENLLKDGYAPFCKHVSTIQCVSTYTTR